MYVTPSGIVTDVKPLQPRNADSPMYVTPSGIVRERNFSPDMPLGKNGAVSPVGATPEKASLPMVFTLEGIVTDSSPLQP